MVLRIAATAGMLLALSQAAFAAPTPAATGMMMKHSMKGSSMKGGSMKGGSMKSSTKKPLMGKTEGTGNVGGSTTLKPGESSTQPKGAPPPHSP